jgi:hypothetical protein
MTQRPVGDPDKPSRRVVEQRVRNRIIAYLEVASSLEAQQEYERDVPMAHVPYEVINQWDDRVRLDRFPEGTLRARRESLPGQAVKLSLQCICGLADLRSARPCPGMIR